MKNLALSKNNRVHGKGGSPSLFSSAIGVLLAPIRRKTRDDSFYGICVKLNESDPYITHLQNDEQLVEVLLEWGHMHCVMELYRYLINQARWESVYTIQMGKDISGVKRAKLTKRDKQRHATFSPASGTKTHGHHTYPAPGGSPGSHGAHSYPRATGTSVLNSPKERAIPGSMPHKNLAFHRLQNKKSPREITFIFLRAICMHIDESNYARHASFLNQFLFCVKHELILDQMERHSPLYQNRITLHQSSAATMRGKIEEKKERDAVEALLSSLKSPDGKHRITLPGSPRIKWSVLQQQHLPIHENSFAYERTLATFLSCYRCNPFKEILIIDMKQQKIDFSRVLFHCVHSNQLMERIQEFFEHRLDLCFRNPFEQLQTALHYASVLYRAPAIKYLLDAGVDPNIVDIHGNSSLMCMISHYFEEVVHMDHTRHIDDVVLSKNFPMDDDEGYFTDDEEDKQLSRLHARYDQKFRLLKQCLMVYLQYDSLDLDMVNHDGHTIQDMIKIKSRSIHNLHTTMEKNGELVELLYMYSLNRASRRNGAPQINHPLHQRSRSLSSIQDEASIEESQSVHPFCGDCFSTHIVPFDCAARPSTPSSVTKEHVKQSMQQYVALKEKIEIHEETIHRIREELALFHQYHKSLMQQVGSHISSLIRSLETKPLESMNNCSVERKSVLLFHEIEEFYIRVCARVLAGEKEIALPSLFNPLDFIIQDPKREVRDFVQWKHVMWEWTLHNFNQYSAVISLDSLLARHAYNISPGDLSYAETGSQICVTPHFNRRYPAQLSKSQSLDVPFRSMIFMPFSSSIVDNSGTLPPDASFFDMMKFYNRRPFINLVDDPETYFFTKLMRNVKSFVDHSEDYTRDMYRDQELAEYLAVISSPLYGIDLTKPEKQKKKRRPTRKRRKKKLKE